MTDADQGYLLGSSETEQERLIEMLQQFPVKRLLEVVRPGMRVLDVGCGPGAVTAVLAHTVGPTGSVIGVDLQQAHLDRASVYAERLGCKNVTFQLADADALPFEDETFDLVYAKFLVMHLLSPRTTIAEMTRTLRPSGVLFLYDFDEGGCLFWPEDTAAHRAYRVMTKVLRLAGADPAAGRRLYGYLRDTGLRDVKTIPEMSGATAAQPGRLSGAKRQFAGVLTSMRRTVTEGGHMTDEALDELLASLEHPVPNEFLTTTGVNCWGVKRAPTEG